MNDSIFGIVPESMRDWTVQVTLDDILNKGEEFLYLALNDGRIDCKNIEQLVIDFKKYIKGDLDS